MIGIQNNKVIVLVIKKGVFHTNCVKSNIGVALHDLLQVK
jgi:hypothetical protein